MTRARTATTLLLLATLGCGAGCSQEPPARSETPPAATPTPPGDSRTSPDVAEASSPSPPEPQARGARQPKRAASIPPSPSAARRRPLRRITHRLIDQLEAAEVTPAATGEPPYDCLGRQPEEPFANAYSTLPGALKAHHQRVTLRSEGQGLAAFRDALLVRLPRTFRLELRAPPEARLEFAYRAFGCDERLRQPTVLVTYQARGKSPVSIDLDLEATDPRRGSPWFEQVVELPLAAGTPFVLSLTFQSRSDAAALAWAEPVITGRPSPDRPERDRNVLLITIDALRGDVVGPGRLVPTVTPQLDALFARGTSYRRAYSVSNQTRPSTIALLQSEVPTVGRFHSMSWWLKDAAKEAYYRTDPPLITRAVARHGWRVATFGHNHFLWDSRPIGLDHAFDQAVDHRWSTTDTPRMTDSTIRFIEQHRDERWFVMIGYMAPHTPYRPPQEARKRVDRALGVWRRRGIPRNYLGEVAWVDEHLGRLIDAVDRLELADRTLIIVTSDHGEVMSPKHACYSKRFTTNCHLSHGLTLYEEELHVPLAFVLQGAAKAGHVVDLPVSHLSIAPTIAKTLGLPAEPRHVGRSLVPDLLGGPGEDRPVYCEGRAAAAIRAFGKKLIVHHEVDDTYTWSRTGGTDARPQEELYDLSVDPDEITNLMLTQPERAKPLREALERARSRPEPTTQSTTAVRRVTPTPVAAGPRSRSVLLVVPDERKRALSGVIRVPAGRLACSHVVGRGWCRAESPTEVRLLLEAEVEPSRLSFETWPWEAPLDMEFELDGETLPLHELRLGPFGLGLLEPGQELDGPDRLALITGAVEPRLKSGQLGVYLWREPKPSQAEAEQDDVGPRRGPEGMVFDPDADAQLDEDLRRLLRELGYSK